MPNSTENDSQHAAIVAGIYHTLRAPQTWTELVEQIGVWIGATCGFMTVPALPGVSAVPLVIYNLDLTPIMGVYPSYAGRAEFTQRALATGRTPGAFLLDELMPPEERATSAYWRDMVAPLNVSSGIFMLIRGPEESERPVILNYYRMGDLAPFTAADATKLELLIPDLRRALSLLLDAPPQREIAPAARDLAAAVDAPCFLIAADGAVAHKNHAAEALLANGDGVRLCGDRLKLCDSDAQREFDIALKRVIGQDLSITYRSGAELLARRRGGETAMVLVLTPLASENPLATLAAPTRCALFVLEDKLRPTPLLPDRLRRLYNLTTAEAAVCFDIASGLSMSEIGEQRGTSIETVRSQVKTALAKTGARRQADLAALVSRLRY